jgi:hydrogenase 3 maturation protease
MKKAPAWKRRLAGALGKAERLAVLGVGNTARGDDAAGVRAAQIIQKRLAGKDLGQVRVFIGHEVPENLTGPIRGFAPSHVLIIDAASGGYARGSIFLVDPDSMAAEDVSAHRIPLSVLSRYLQGTAGCSVTILGIEPESFVVGARLTPSVRKAVGSVSETVGRIARARLRSSSASRRRYS